MENENNPMEESPTEPVEAKNLSEEINEFNRKIDLAIEDIQRWKANLINLQEDFTTKLRERSLALKIK